MDNGWIGFDLDGTLAVYTQWHGPDQIGEPIAPMIEQLKRFRKRNTEVRIFTARVYYGPPGSYASEDAFWRRKQDAITARRAIQEWCLRHIGEVLPITCVKDFGMIALFDDRCVQVRKNTGEMLGDVVAVLGEETDP